MSAAKRPSWLLDDCPAWCDYSEFHVEGLHFDDRVHTGAAVRFPLTADHAKRVFDDEPTIVEVSLYQHYREIEARVHVGKDDAPGMYLTLDEAEQLARELFARVAMARGVEGAAHDR